MNVQKAIAPVVKTVTVEASVERAFGVFTEGIATWWPLSTHSIGLDDAMSVMFEARIGGRIYEVCADGTEHEWGEVVECDPPNRIVYSWQPGSPAPTEVEIRFTAEGSRTRVDLEHRYWERLGDRAEEARSDYNSGWDIVIARYVGSVSA